MLRSRASARWARAVSPCGGTPRGVTGITTPPRFRWSCAVHRRSTGCRAFWGLLAGGPGNFGDSQLGVLPAGGAGLRFQLTRKYPMHLRLDYAWGHDGGLLYFSVGEAI